MKRLCSIIMLVIMLIAGSSCSREKKLFHSDMSGSFTLSCDASCRIYFHPAFDSPSSTSFGVTKYGTLHLEVHTDNKSDGDFMSFIITDPDSQGNYGYGFMAMCVEDKITSEYTKKKSRKKKSQAESYVGTTWPMEVTLNPKTGNYSLEVGQIPLFAKYTEPVPVFEFCGYISAAEAARPKMSHTLTPYIGYTLLYPSRYLGDWMVDYEWIFIAVAIAIVIICLLHMNLFGALVTVAVIYLSFYTSWMVFLPCVPFLLLIPLAYIPKVPNSMSFTVLAAVFLGLWMLYQVYEGSTLWNALLVGIVWTIGLGVFIGYLTGYQYAESNRCKDCGHILVRSRDDSSYVRLQIDDVERYIPVTGKDYEWHGELSVDKDKECRRCKLII